MTIKLICKCDVFARTNDIHPPARNCDPFFAFLRLYSDLVELQGSSQDVNTIILRLNLSQYHARL